MCVKHLPQVDLAIKKSLTDLESFNNKLHTKQNGPFTKSAKVD